MDIVPEIPTRKDVSTQAYMFLAVTSPIHSSLTPTPEVSINFVVNVTLLLLHVVNCVVIDLV